MSIFRKKTRTHFERDKAGRITSVTRTGDVGTPIYDSLKGQVKTTLKESKKKRKDRRQIYSEEYEKAAHKELKAKAKRKAKAKYTGGGIASGFASGFGLQPVPSSYPRTRKKKARKKYAVVGGKAYPLAQKKRKTTKSKPKKQSKNIIDDIMSAGDKFF